MANDSSKGTSAPDTQKLAEDIERTREGLAETLDAIADKVSPKRVMDRTKTQARADAQQAVATVKEASANAAEVVKVKVSAASASTKVMAASAAESVKSGVAQVKERVGGDDDPVRSPLSPATSVAVGSAAPVSSTGELADATTVLTEPAGADAPAWTPYPSTDSGPNVPLLAGASAAALAALLLVLRRRKGRGGRRRRR